MNQPITDLMKWVIVDELSKHTMTFMDIIIATDNFHPDVVPVYNAMKQLENDGSILRLNGYTPTEYRLQRDF